MKAKNLLKKAFLLLALMGGATSAWADETTIYSWESPSGTPVETGGTVAVSAGTKSSDGINEATVTIAGTYNVIKLQSKNDENTGYSYITFNQALQENDQIKISGFQNKDATDKIVNIKILFFQDATEKGNITEATDANWVNLFNNQNYANAEEPETKTFNVTAALAGSNVIRIFRAKSGTNLWINKIEVIRSTAATEKYTVTFNAGSNGTCGTSSLTEESIGAGVTLPAVTPNSGFVFNGWFDAASEGTKVGNAGATYYPTANTTVYAQYSAETAPGISIDSYNPSTTRSKAIAFTATPTGAPAPTVTWYQSETATTSGGTEKGTGLTYNPDVATEGTYYYYAVASNGVSPNATSELITLTVTNPDIVRTGYNTYYLAKGNQPVGGSSVFCDDITMVYDDVTLGTAGEDNMINSLNSKYVSSVSCSTNGWGVSFTPTADGVLSVGVIANKDKYIEITNVSSFDYIDNDSNSGTYSGTTSEQLAAKFYGIVTFNVVSGTTYKVSVTGGSKIGFYGFEFAPSVSLNASGYATYSNAFAVKVSGAKAYTAELDFANETITCTEIASDKVPAGNGVLLYGEPGATVTLTPTTGASALGTNNLKATTLANGSLATKGANNYYALSGDTFMEYTGAEFVHNKAYFEVGGSTVLARSMSIVLGDKVTGVENVEAASEAKAKDGKFVEGNQLYIYKKGVKYNAAGQQVK